ncbi:MAG TPA: hypothetical protein VIM20_08860 [Candidatus Limnocylindrales bacterium]
MAIAIHSSRQSRRAVLFLAVAFLVALGGLLITARPVAACSCATSGSIKDYAKPENAIFTGTAGVARARGVPVQVDQWLWGTGAAPVVWLAASSFGDGASCGTTPPKPGTAWLWVAWLPGNRGDFGTGLCSPSGDLATPEGQAMLADALTVFQAIPPPAATPEPTAAAAGPAGTPDPVATARDATGLAIGAVLVAASLALFGVLALAARRSSRRLNRP